MRARLVLLLSLTLALLAGCAPPPRIPQAPPRQMSMDQIAEAYVKTVLALGELDPGYVDAYYGPPEWQQQAKAQKKSLLEIRNVVAKLFTDVETAPADAAVAPELFELRRTYLKNHIGALWSRARMLEGWKPSFESEALALYDIAPPRYPEADLQAALAAVEKLLPADAGSLAERYNAYMDRYAIPPQRLQAVMLAAIEAARARSKLFIPLPPDERFELAFVSGQPWSAYNWYQGQYVSRIEINTDLPTTVSRAIELASHEGYPGHHVYNLLLEQQLVKGHGWIEYQVYPLYSPQSFIAEGSADYGVQLAFPKAERIQLLRRLFQITGFNPADVERYDAIVQASRGLGHAGLEAARRYRDGEMDRRTTEQWLQRYTLASPARARQRVDFFDRYGAYVINYSYGEEIVRRWVARSSGSAEPDQWQWRVFRELLSTPRTPNRLLQEVTPPATP